MSETPVSPYMTRREAADYLRCSVEKIDRQMIRERWRYDLDGRRVLIHREDVVNSPKQVEVPGTAGRLGSERKLCLSV